MELDNDAQLKKRTLLWDAKRVRYVPFPDIADPALINGL